MSRIIGAVLLVAAFVVVPASAQELPSPLLRQVSFVASDLTAPPPLVSFAVPPTNEAEPAVESRSGDPTPGAVTLPPSVGRRMTTVNLLCASFAALQVADLHATYRAMGYGAREANPLMSGIAGNKAAMIGFKAGATAATIYLVQKFGVKNRTAATIFMVVANSAYAMIAAHNYRMARPPSR